MKSFFRKGEATRTKVVILVIVSIIAAFVLTSIARKGFIWDRVPIIAVGCIFIGLHFIFEIKDIYEFIYKYRYYFAILFLAYVVLMGYSGSSIGTYNEVIPGGDHTLYYTPIFGKYRSIRSDEWAVSAPFFISQGVDSNGNNYSYYNDSLRGTITDMFSEINPPVFDILTIGKIFNVGFFLFGVSRGYSFLWYGSLVFLIIVSFEFFMLITKKNKLISLLGMLLVTFSASTQWWQCFNIFSWGMFAILLFDKFMLTKELKVKVLCALGLIVAAMCYIFYFYPAWQLSYGYIYLALTLWVVIKNRKEYKINLRDIFIILFAILIVAGLLYRYYLKSSESLNLIMNTDYPGERFELGGGAKDVMFSYVYSMLFPYITLNNPCELSGMITFYPIPIFLSIIYLIRNRKNKEHFIFLIPIIIISIIYSIWALIGGNRIFAKLSLLYMVPAKRIAIPLGFTQILLMIYMLANIKKEEIIIKSQTIKKIIAIISSILVMYIALKTDNNILQNHPLFIYINGLILVYGLYQLLNINLENNKKKLVFLLIPIALITGLTVHPIQKGISVLTDKPVAKKTQELIKNNSDKNLWLIDSTNFYMNNYLLASGAKIINTTNIYTNFDLYKTVLGENSDNEDKRKIYNRYAHVDVEITENKNDVELKYQDNIKLYLTTEKVKELGVNYILTTRSLEQFNTDIINYNKVYDEYGLFIYEVQY